MYKLIYPTVDLFLYDLRDGLGQSDEKITENRQNFWRKIDPTVINPSATNENPDKDFVKLHSQRFPEPLDGMYFALQIGDTYFLQVDASEVVSPKEPTLKDKPRPLEQLALLKKLVISKVNHHEKAGKIDSDKLGTLGQTWLVWGKATANNSTQADLTKIAEECFSHLSPDPKWKSQFTGLDTKIGDLAGAKVFEYTRTPKNWTDDLEEFSQENYHLVILLFPANAPEPDELRKRIKKISFDLVKLFAYRHKIIWSYWNSRRLKAELKKDAQQMQDLRQQIQDYQTRSFDLDRLQQKLTESLPTLAEYSTKLNEMSSQGHTIKINIENYQKRLTKIVNEVAQNNPDLQTPNLQVFQKFISTAEERYHQQIIMDYEGLQAVLTILENLTRTIDTLVNIERTKVESQQNTTIAIAGLGLAASSAFAGITATQVYQPNNDGKEIVPWTSASSETARIHWWQGLGFSLIPVAFTLLIWLYFKKKWEK